MPSRQSPAVAPKPEPRITYAAPDPAVARAEAEVKRLAARLSDEVLSERDRGQVAFDLIKARNALHRALNPGLFR